MRPVLAEARARYGISMSAGRAETLGKLIRIGHMGDHTLEELNELLDVLAEVVR